MRKFALLALPALVAAPLALAAPMPQPPANTQKPAAPASAPSVDSAALHKFAAAYEDVRVIRTKYMIRFKTAKDDKDKAAIRKEAIKDIKQHIAKHMPVSEYMKVAKAVNANPAMRKRLVKIMQADAKAAGPSQSGG